MKYSYKAGGVVKSPKKLITVAVASVIALSAAVPLVGTISPSSRSSQLNTPTYDTLVAAKSASSSQSDDDTTESSNDSSQSSTSSKQIVVRRSTNTSKQSNIPATAANEQAVPQASQTPIVSEPAPADNAADVVEGSTNDQPPSSDTGSIIDSTTDAVINVVDGIVPDAINL